MAALTIQTIAEAGITPSYAAAAGGGDTAANPKGDVLLHVKNGGGGSITVTVTAQNQPPDPAGFGAVTKANVAVAVGPGAEAMIGPFARDAFNDASADIAITYSGVTSVTIGAFRLPRT